MEDDNLLSFKRVLPEPDILLSLEPEEVASFLLVVLKDPANSILLNINNIGLDDYYNEFPQQYKEDIIKAIMEAWSWLEREGLIARSSGQHGEWFFITRRGEKLANVEDVEKFRHSNLLPKSFLHPLIAQKVLSNFIRGEYVTAVFLAFKEVEIAVRKAGGFKSTDLGVKLMRDAFNIEKGPLTDNSLPESERSAIQHLFAGAIGYYKNPPSHRDVIISDPIEAIEMIILASHLMRIIESRNQEIE